MKMPSSTPSTSAWKLETWKGLSHEKLNGTSVSTLVVATLTNATTENSASVSTSAVSSHRCVRALSSMPMTQIHVIRTIQRTPMIDTAHAVEAALVMPNSRNV